MSDTPSSAEPSPPSQVDGGPSDDLEIAIAAFLPDGVELGDPAATPGPVPGDDRAIDLDALEQIERDLDAVDAAISALDAGTYGVDPATGQPLDDALLAADPTRLGP